jgi:hypothetical protein
MVTNKVSEAAETANKSATSTPVGAEFAASRARRRGRTCGELAAEGSLGAAIVTTPRRTPNYRAPAPHTDRDPPSRTRTIEREEEPPPPQSALAVRLIDGAIFASLQDAPADVDLRGREVVRFLRLTDNEILRARASFDETHADIVANIIGRLPGRST